jgi:acyl carrier protein
MLSNAKTSAVENDRGQVFEAVRAIVAEHATARAEDIREEHHLENDLGCDSLDIVEISMEIEEHFDISIPDEVSERSPTVDAFVEGVIELLKDR